MILDPVTELSVFKSRQILAKIHGDVILQHIELGLLDIAVLGLDFLRVFPGTLNDLSVNGVDTG